MILSICEDPKVLEITRLINIFITIIRIIVPIALIFSLMFKLVGAITKSDEDGLSKVKKIAPKNLIAAAIIFLVPTIVRLVVRVTASDISYENCLRVVPVSEIQSAYKNKMEELMLRAEENVNKDNYNAAYKYVKNIKDSDVRQEYEERLAEVKTKIDESNHLSGGKGYSKVNYNAFSWTYYNKNSGPNAEYYSQTTPYAIWAPDDPSNLNGVSIPLIVWLHGYGERTGCSESCFLSRGLPIVVSNWDEYNLENIPAIIVAPQSGVGWMRKENYETIKALINYTKDKYNIDTNNIVLMGHSMGGNGTINLASEMPDTFVKYVIMSNNIAEYGSKEFYKNLKIKGYGEDSSQKTFFKWCGHENDFTLYPGTAHGQIPMKVMTEDSNNDGISDLLYWLFYEE